MCASSLRKTGFIGRESGAFLFEFFQLLANRSERDLVVLDFGDRPFGLFVVRILDRLLLLDGLYLLCASSSFAFSSRDVL